MTTITLRGQEHGGHIWVQIFAGTDHPKAAGTIVLTPHEWHLVAAALLAGSLDTAGNLKVLVEGPLGEVVPDAEGRLDLELLAKLASGEGGRRTGALIRAGLLEVTVTPAGRQVLAAQIDPDPMGRARR